MRLRSRLCVALFAALLLSPVAARANQPITYLLPAPPALPAFAPWILAKQLGYYADAGYDVTFVTAKGGVDVAKQVGAGNAPVGVALGDSPVIVRPNGIPVKTVGLMGGGALSVIVARGDRHIEKVQDLRGKTITVMSYQEANYFAILGTLARAGIAKTDADVEAVGPAGVVQLVAAGKADACVCTPDWEIDLKALVPDTVSIPTVTTFPTMAQGIMASDATIAKQPELLKALVRASVRGMEYVIADPQKAAQAYAQAQPDFAEKLPWLTQVLANYKQRTYVGQSVPGAVDPARLAALQDFYLAQGVIQTKQPLDALYTNQFVQ
jgi:NitT/TauT family transport system substrate-binding protein